jgi:hypothetical protein
LRCHLRLAQQRIDHCTQQHQRIKINSDIVIFDIILFVKISIIQLKLTYDNEIKNIKTAFFLLRRFMY